jgi:ATP/maltotriose-dependent transcriptional regulator MalT/DNA-binding SARP family transcriptional activator
MGEGRATAATPAGGTGETATTKLRPPAPPAPLLRRERLLSALEGARERRLTTVVAGAGFGKSTLLADWAAELNCAWYTASPDDASFAGFARGVADAIRLRVPALPADAAAAVTATAGPGAEQDEASRARGFAAIVCETLQAELRRDLVLVLDDVHETNGAPGAVHVIESLCRQAPDRFHLVVASRSELPFPIERLRGQGQVLELSGSDLAFDAAETAALLAGIGADIGGDDAAALELHRATGGWPAAVRLAVETLRGIEPGDRATMFDRIRRPGGPLLAYLAAEVFAHEPPKVEALVRTVASIDRFTAELCEALGNPDAGEILRSLARRGLVVELQGHTTGWFALSSPVRQFALARGLRDGDARSVLVGAARWFEAHGEPEEALRCFSSAGVYDEVARALALSGPRLLASGSVDTVLDAVALLPAALRSPEIEQLAGEAFQVRGDWDEALRCFDRAASDPDRLPPALAWRIGLLHHLGGRLDAAVAAYGRATDEGDPRDVALLLAWRGSAHWLRGDADACRADAQRSFSIASDANDAQALAAAHTVLAMLAALEGDRGANDAHYLRALDYAQQAGDVLQLIRVRTNRGSRHVEEGAYEEAISELDLALRFADLAGFAAFRALALTNRGEALARLGRFEEAVADLEAGKELYQRLGSRMVSYPLEKLGEVYRARGEWALARAAFAEAVAQSEAAGDAQGLVPALCGLARVTAADEPAQAERLVARALEQPGMDTAHALLASAWVALARGERMLADERATRAADEAGVRRDRASLAEALEVRALAASDANAAAERLDEAASIWRDLQDPAGQARAELEAALLRGDRVAAAEAEGRLVRIGARGYRPTLSFLPSADDTPPVVVQSLGRFRVFRDGEPVPLAAWQSRKARDLFKMLVGRRGRPTARDVLMEALWPEQSPDKLGNRLSVLLSTVRSVLDPAKRHGPDHFVVADRNAVWLDTDHVSLDVAAFLEAAGDALALRRARDPRAHDQLVAAEAVYTGDFLEEDAYEDWAIGLREESRALYTHVVRALAEDAMRDGETDAATRYHLRILERDQYDEPAHLGLVTTLEAARRHGEARRCFRLYCARMDEIGVESAAFPGAPATAAAV